MARIDVYIKGQHPQVDSERLAATLARHAWGRPFTAEQIDSAAKQCAAVIMDPNDTSMGTAIGMRSMDAAEDLRDALIDIGIPAEIIEHDADSA